MKKKCDEQIENILQESFFHYMENNQEEAAQAIQSVYLTFLELEE